jgi:diadenosine tetraphosphate (Ap4A) HIT family hydrolase
VIYEGAHWIVDHAYPCGMKGWLVIVLKRHAEALHELSGVEVEELGRLVGKSSNALHDVLGTKKEYVALFSEAEHFNHLHVQVVARSVDLGLELMGPAIFKMLKPTELEVIAPEELKKFCEVMQGHFK